jgi:sulfate adenylyltransferase
MIEPHGGHLVDQTVSTEAYERHLGGREDVAEISLDERMYQDVVNIAIGRYSPLRGFMTRDDFLKVVHDMTLEDGTVWPLPIVNDVDAETAADLEPGGVARLVGPDGEAVGLLEVEEVYKYNKTETARQVFGTDDDAHPGVANYYAQEDFLVGGPIRLLEGLRYHDRDVQPKESRVLFRHYGWDTVVGFQTRNAPHRGHEYIQKCALEQVDGLLVQPKLGEKKAGDYQDETIVGAYDVLVREYYPDRRVVLSVFPSRMRYAGPREAVFDALVRKNQGCTHFIIGRDHAGVGDYYEPDGAHRIFEEISDVGIEPMLFDRAFYCTACDGMCSAKICPHDGEMRMSPSGSTIRRLIREGGDVSEKVMRPEIVQFAAETSNTFVEGS